MPAPGSGPPLGLDLARTAKAVSRAFDDALADAGGSLPVWLILTSLKTRSTRNQRELADAVGINGATLTHHLNAMETDGLVTRRRDPANRRIHLVDLTERGQALVERLWKAAVGFDRQLRAGVSGEDVERVLYRLRNNVADDEA